MGPSRPIQFLQKKLLLLFWRHQGEFPGKNLGGHRGPHMQGHVVFFYFELLMHVVFFSVALHVLATLMYIYPCTEVRTDKHRYS